MNFFQHQDDARRKSAQLVALLVAAVFALIAITTLIVAALLFFIGNHSTSVHAAEAYSQSFAHHFVKIITSEIVLWIASGVCLVVVLGSLYKSSELKRGGDHVAQALGGRLLLRESATIEQKVLLNVVEEMAIASGAPVPRAYVLADSTLNAFAAGTTTSNAVIGVTQGCIDHLNREQLQGVIAHEFSHIHHGDMKLNMRLIAILHGILLIGLIGELLLRSSSSRSVFRSRNSKSNNGAIIGIALMAVGFGGVFFGNIIKAAVSRQREFLADASAVQYTRNPQGIGAALFKIKHGVGHSGSGSELGSKNAAEFSHFFFAKAVTSFFANMFATHPNLDIRIARVYPGGEPELAELIANEQKFKQRNTNTQNNVPRTDDSEKSSDDKNIDHESSATENSQNSADAGFFEHALDSAPAEQNLQALIDSIGVLNPVALDYSHALLATLPASITNACQSPYQARAVVYALLLDASDNEIKRVQITHLSKRAHPATYKEFQRLYCMIIELDSGLHFPMLQLAMPALAQLSEKQAELFHENMAALIKADKRISLREWSVFSFVKSATEKQDTHSRLSLNQLQKPATELLGAAAKLNDTHQQQASLDTAVKTLWPNSESHTLPKSISIKSLNKSLKQLKQLKPIQKPQLLKALAVCIAFDESVSMREKELLRTISAVLDCPMPIIH